MSQAGFPDHRLDLDAAVLEDADFAAYRARERWLLRARSPTRLVPGKQIPPDDLAWQILLFLAGRGFGKTEALTQYGFWEGWENPGIIVHYVAPTLSDVRGTSFEGPAGLLNVVPYECLFGGSVARAYNSTLHELKLNNGTLFRGFGAVDGGGRLRGPQCHRLLGDELREWDKPAGNLETALDNALFGLRLQHHNGSLSRAVLGTTPKPIPYLKRLHKQKGVRVVHGTSYENLANLSESYRNHLLAKAGTLIGRQEIDAAYIDEESDLSIIKRNWIKLWPAGKPLPEFSFIIETYDTATSEANFDKKKMRTDPTASLVLGIFNIQAAFPDREVLRKMGVTGRNGALVLDCWTEYLGLPDLLEKAKEQHNKKWGPQGKARKSDVILIEDKSSGPSMRQMMQTWGVPCWPYHPRPDKAQRLHGVSPIIKQGGLWVPESNNEARAGQPRDWILPFLEQVCAFAGEGSVEHDDFVDTLSSSFDYLHQRGMLTAEPIRKYVDLEEKLDEDRREAAKVQAEQQRREVGNPYG